MGSDQELSKQPDLLVSKQAADRLDQIRAATAPTPEPDPTRRPRRRLMPRPRHATHGLRVVGGPVAPDGAGAACSDAGCARSALCPTGDSTVGRPCDARRAGVVAEGADRVAGRNGSRREDSHSAPGSNGVAAGQDDRQRRGRRQAPHPHLRRGHPQSARSAERAGQSEHPGQQERRGKGFGHAQRRGHRQRLAGDSQVDRLRLPPRRQLHLRRHAGGFQQHRARDGPHRHPRLPHELHHGRRTEGA